MISFDLSALEQAARNVGAASDQIPYAISRTLNRAVLNAENRLAGETWPSHVTVRNRGFLKAALAPEFSKKDNLRVALVDKLGRASLNLHDKGGTKTARGRFAIPTSRVRRGSKGVVASQRPGELKRKVVKGGLIFQAVGKGKNQRLQLMFKLQSSSRVKADVPLRKDFARFMREEMWRELPKAVAQAMATRR
ncbi:hypothetical protein [Methylobacterium soli]|uniref:Uncharacterized protein n=1 Tax=Methylobacterium soli TaxID=553447 RepID=A0A6L3SZ74_9HYPH|nr:hypothetical protein [Methylobacterium soli]KAB1079433.1 hypothetical protein F6X53_11560 [Methylobacterium soli]GJE45937.1 hypothetical protein AEGHOMDF_5137 [Methylobacterium soli]